MSGTIVIISVNGETSERRWPKSGMPNWETLRDCVGGYIERVKVQWAGKLRDGFVNENGLAEGLTYNYKGSEVLGGLFRGQDIVGPLAIWIPDPKVRK